MARGAVCYDTPVLQVQQDLKPVAGVQAPDRLSRDVGLDTAPPLIRENGEGTLLLVPIITGLFQAK